ncbi:hypothetical protein Ade02nite_27950 [Paractinoplanes deccanensis]|uniref:SIR2-like domain-containing protein n=1 Tax=Paractinoplanes deccanensis TaxID=113561 RepID=A0ABQ3Y2E1_9ACTN|nr:SIR2 family protein [Actinoplanes deccanensis]GID74154.1 hypothetical protein Ade02nite_27950 [Actinoplanes deccanensis]
MTLYAGEADLVERLATLLRSGAKKCVPLLGSGVTRPTMPDTETILGLADEYARQQRNDDLVRSLDQIRAEAGKSIAQRYQEYRNAFAGWLGPDKFDIIVQRAVLHAYRPSEDLAAWADRAPWQLIDLATARRIELDDQAWSLTDATTAIGRLVTWRPHRFGHQILTTNVDPTLEIAIGRAGGHFTTLVPGNNGAVVSLVTDPGPINIVHLHGYWRPLREDDSPLHDPRRLARTSHAFRSQLRELLRESVVCVLGYGGADQVIVDTLRAMLADNEIELLWAIRESAPSPDSPIHTWEGSGAGLYSGVDVNTLLPAVVERLGIRRGFTPAPAQPPATITRVSRRVPQPELVKAIGALPLRRPPQDVSELLRQLVQRFGWRLEPPRSAPAPTLLFWPVRLRRPSLIHMVQALAAAAMSTHGVRVVLSLDDFGVQRKAFELFAARAREWFSLIPGAELAEVVSLQEVLDASDVFGTGPGDADAMVRPFRPWAVLYEYYAVFRPSLYSVLRAAKAIPEVDPDRAIERAPDIVRALLSEKPTRLLTAPEVWAHLHQLMEKPYAKQTLTLGGEDEHRFWAHWREAFQQNTRHLHNPRIVNLSNESDLIHCEHYDDLREQIEQAMRSERWREPNRFVPWLVRNALLLPAYLRFGTGVNLDGQRFDAWQDVLAALEVSPSLATPLAMRISSVFHGGQQT